MAIKKKTIVNDVGSAVLEEVAHQLNNSYGFTLQTVTEAAGAGGAATALLCGSVGTGFWIEDIAVAFQDAVAAATTDIFIEYDDDYAFGAATSVLGREGFNGAGHNVAANAFQSLYGTPSDSDTGALPAWIPAGNLVRVRIINNEGGSVTLHLQTKIRVCEYEVVPTPSYTQKMRNFYKQD